MKVFYLLNKEDSPLSSSSGSSPCESLRKLELLGNKGVPFTKSFKNLKGFTDLRTT